MSDDLSKKIDEYDALLCYYNKEYVSKIDLPILIDYNTLS